jgi:MFS family permease
MAGFFGNAGVSGLYSLVAYGFPTHVRATGTGFVIGIGRGGAVLSPIIAGSLLQSGASLPVIGMIMAAGSLISAIVLIFLKVETGRPVETKEQAPKFTVARARA